MKGSFPKASFEIFSRLIVLIANNCLLFSAFISVSRHSDPEPHSLNFLSWLSLNGCECLGSPSSPFLGDGDELKTPGSESCIVLQVAPPIRGPWGVISSEQKVLRATQNPKRFRISVFPSLFYVAVIKTGGMGFISAYSLHLIIKGSQVNNSRQKPEVKDWGRGHAAHWHVLNCDFSPSPRSIGHWAMQAWWKEPSGDCFSVIVQL